MNNRKEILKDGMNWLKLLFVCMLSSVLLYLFLGELFLSGENKKEEYRCELFVSDWMCTREDGTKEAVKIPGKCEGKRNERITVETRLPADVEDNTYLCILSSRQDMDIYIGDVLRQQYSTENTRIFGKSSAVCYLFLELKGEDSGKTLKIISQSDSSYSGIFNPIYYGDKMGIWHYFFKQHGAELIVAFLTMILAVISIIGSMAMRLCYQRKMELEYLGWGVFIAAVWLIMNSAFRQLIFPNISVVSDMAFFMVMLMPFPFLIYLNEIQNGRYRKWYILAESIILLDFVLCTALHIMKYIDFGDTIVVMAGISLLAIFSLVVTMFMDIKKKNMKEYKMVSIGLLGASIAACFQIFLYFQRTIPFNGVIMALGLIFLLVMATISTIRDILNMEYEKQNAISSSKAKARFLASMSHEIRTPINAVLGMNAMILRESRDSQIKEYALDVQSAAQNLLYLINDILDLSKVESGKFEILPVEYDFSSMIHDIVNMISVKAKSKNLLLKTEVEGHLPSRLLGDENRVRQILINLLNNAVKYTEKGSVGLKVGGRIEGDKVRLHFCIEDTGIGMKEEDIPKLFLEYERIEEKRNRNIEGTGLGMSITTRLLELMGSRLLVESVYGKGSNFSFDLEQQIVNAEPVGDLEQRIHQITKEYSYSASFTAPKAQILAVDDNPLNLKVLLGLLKQTKMNIDTAKSGKECLELIQKKRYDIIFLDHMMPDMDGVETLHYMKQMEGNLCKDTPVVALTANAVSGAKEMYLAEGFDYFMSKPIIPEKIEKVIQRMLPEDLLVYEEEDEGEGLEDAFFEEKNEIYGEDIEEVLPQVDGIDWEYAKMHMPDSSVLKETVQMFYQNISLEADCLEKEFMEQSFDAYRIRVHAMKSSAALIGAVPLAGMAKVLEYAAKNEDMDTLKSLNPVFLREWRGYKDKLKECCEQNEEIAKSQNKMETEDKDVLLAYLEMLRYAANDMDLDKMDAVMEVLEKYSYSEEIQVLIDSLGVAVMNIDVDQVNSLTEALMEKFME